MKDLLFNNVYTVYLFKCDVSVYNFFRHNIPNGFVLQPVIAYSDITDVLNQNRIFLIADADNSDILKITKLFAGNEVAVGPFVIYLSENTEKTGLNNSYGKSKHEYAKILRYIQSFSGMVTYRNTLENLTESIVYAGRIQKSILPDEKILKENFTDFFLYNNPRDIVSGDFYWFAMINDLVYVAVGDCTGHGVPGAFMSILSVTLLNEIVYVGGNYETGDILNKLRNNIINSLSQTFSENMIHDGLDIALCAFKPEYEVVQFSGAFNPALIIRDDEIIELKPDRMPVGIYIRDDIDFTVSHFDYKKGDLIYMFSDGFSDQVGGVTGKKLRKKRFTDLLYENRKLPMKMQKEKLSSFMTKWKGINEQIDDMLILGIKI